jgi:uncharacterized membrane protein
MNLLHLDTPLWLALPGWLIAIAALLHAVHEVRPGFLPTSAAQHAWLAAIVTVCLLWAMHVRSPVGLDFGLLGSALVTLVFGRARAVLGLMAALALYTLLESGSWLGFGINAVVMVLFPAWLASALQMNVVQRLPRNLFVFIIGNGLFVTLLTTASTNLLILGLSAFEAPSHGALLGDHVAYALLLAWGEALLSGMLFSALVVFRPQAVLTYSLDLYLPPRKHLL